MKYIQENGLGKTRAKALAATSYTGTSFFFIPKIDLKIILSYTDLTRFILFSRSGYYANGKRELTTTEKKYYDLAIYLCCEEFFQHNCYGFKIKNGYSFIF